MSALRPVHKHLIDSYDRAPMPDGLGLIAAANRLAHGPLAKAALAALLRVEADEEARARWAPKARGSRA